MSRGFRDADETQAMSEKAIADQIGRILEGGRDDHAARADGGKCIECGADIGEERLAAVPGAVRCVSCQAARERGPGR